MPNTRSNESQSDNSLIKNPDHSKCVDVRLPQEIARSQAKLGKDDSADICDGLKDSANSVSSLNVGVNPTPTPTSSYEKDTSVVFKKKMHGDERKKKKVCR
ncbi:unnamed protein product [Lepeophtheirus salmonis]|uniref:(salmon louse) hypothetical protein n=1 Tax=Lepeophtheirus salmonis TaxID=72036 RepID=A0A7R8H9Z4_LEPSM|nr:unnamed protein product [Lepeophtheirus salmonis]CAF2968655.1 unnamed protein product [Lepeophtheirus salmonis]